MPVRRPSTFHTVGFSQFFVSFDLSIGSTETKYIKLDTKTQNIVCCVNENLTTLLYTLTGGTKKQKEKKKYFLKCIKKWNVIKKNWVLVFGFSRSMDLS